jgi:hypothetical protein
MFSWIVKAFSKKTDKQYVEEYLSQSISLEDLERRQCELRQRGYLA